MDQVEMKKEGSMEIKIVDSVRIIIGEALPEITEDLDGDYDEDYSKYKMYSY